MFGIEKTLSVLLSRETSLTGKRGRKQTTMNQLKYRMGALGRGKFRSGTLLVSYDHYKKLPQTLWLKTKQKNVLSHSSGG